MKNQFRLPSAWTSHIRTEKEKADFVKGLSAATSTKVWDRLIELVNTRLDHIEKAEQDYNNPSWAYRQAHYNGYRQATKDILALINLHDKEN